LLFENTKGSNEGGRAEEDTVIAVKTDGDREDDGAKGGGEGGQRRKDKARDTTKGVEGAEGVRIDGSLPSVEGEAFNALGAAFLDMGEWKSAGTHIYIYALLCTICSASLFLFARLT
jgi:hypothetical protein